MSTPSHPEAAPLNDTSQAKNLEPDPQLEKVEQLKSDARNLGMSQDEAQALAWSHANDPDAADTSRSPPHSDDAHAPDMSVGG